MSSLYKRRSNFPKSFLFLAPIFLANVLTCLSISSMYTDIDISNGSGDKMNVNVSSIGHKILNSPKPLPLTQTRKKSAHQNHVQSRTRNQPSSSNDLQKQEQSLVDTSESSSFHLNEYCEADIPLEKVTCTGVHWKDELPLPATYFQDIQEATFDNLTQAGDIHIMDIHRIFPRLIVLKLSFVESGSGGVSGRSFLSNFLQHTPDSPSPAHEFKFESIRVLNLTRNRLSVEWIPKNLLSSFPQLESLDLSRNNITSLIDVVNPDWLRLQSIDLSENPLDCTTDFDWIDKSTELKLVNPERTLCELPPHQNKPKPIVKVYPLVKRVREECRLNCTCFVDYIWEQDKAIHAKTTVNCSHRSLIDFPDPDKMPHPTDTLLLDHNHIESLERFVEDDRYAKLNVMNLFLNNNNISSMSPLEGSDWFYHFQILSLRNNHISEVPVYALENVLRQNKRLYFIDLSQNQWKCDCNTVHNFKVWLLRHSVYVKNVEEVYCSQTHEQVRHIKEEDWCKLDDAPIIEILDVVSITLAFLIVIGFVVIWNLRRYLCTSTIHYMSSKC